MKLSTILPFLHLAVALPSKPRPLPDSFSLTSTIEGLDNVIYPQLMFANSSAYIGNIKYAIYSEPLKLHSGENSTGVSFTSFHSSPTGFTSMYIFPSESKPIGFTVPHSGHLPKGAEVRGFTRDSGQLSFNGSAHWQACPVAPGSYQIYWDGNGMLKCQPVELYVDVWVC